MTVTGNIKATTYPVDTAERVERGRRLENAFKAATAQAQQTGIPIPEGLVILYDRLLVERRIIDSMEVEELRRRSLVSDDRPYTGRRIPYEETV